MCIPVTMDCAMISMDVQLKHTLQGWSSGQEAPNASNSRIVSGCKHLVDNPEHWESATAVGKP